MKVDIYRNLRTGLWSIRHKGRVFMHASKILLDDVEFVVSKAGRERVLRERRRNVHAVARGRVRSLETTLSCGTWRQVTYNPYRFDSFVLADDLTPVHSVRQAYFTGGGAVFVENCRAKTRRA